MRRRNQENVADIIESALKLLKDVEDSGDVRVIQTAIRELRYAFKLFAPYSDARKVTIFGSARLKPGTPAYDGVRKLAAELVTMGCDILTGGGPGLMQAANEGAHSVAPEAGKRS